MLVTSQLAGAGGESRVHRVPLLRPAFSLSYPTPSAATRARCDLMGSCERVSLA